MQEAVTQSLNLKTEARSLKLQLACPEIELESSYGLN